MFCVLPRKSVPSGKEMECATPHMQERFAWKHATTVNEVQQDIHRFPRWILTSSVISCHATSSYFISCSTCLVSSCHVKSCFVMLRYSMSRHLKPFHVMLYMYVLIPVMSVHVICHLSHVKSGINTIFVIRTIVCALCWPVNLWKAMNPSNKFIQYKKPRF